MFENRQIRQMSQPKMFRTKSLSDELFLHFSFESSESDRVFNYLHVSNSIFRARGINSEWVFRYTVIHCSCVRNIKPTRSPTEFDQNNRDVTSIPGHVIKKNRSR